VKNKSPRGASSLFVSVWVIEGDPTPKGLLLQTTGSDPQRHLIPWSVLPGRVRQEAMDLVRYAGVRPHRRPSPDPAQRALKL